MSVAGAVLAAGASSRMGTNKALLRAGNRSFLVRLAAALEEGGCRPVLAVVSGDTAAHAEADPHGSARLVVNPDPSRGQISSLRCALDAATDAEGLLVVLVDQGGIEAATVRTVREILAWSEVVVARHGGVAGHPTAFSCSMFAALRGPEADQGARALVERAALRGQIRYVDVADPGVTRNINTPEQYEAYLGESEPTR